jgi:RNA polymerase sigma factor (sigma-70 family)
MQYAYFVVPASSGSFDKSLSAAQAQVFGAAEAFIVAHDDWVVRTTRALCRKLGVPQQEYKDAVQETYRRILDPQLKRFAPDLGGGKSYVRGVILNAIDFAGRNRRRAREDRSATEIDELPDVVDEGSLRCLDQVEKRVDLPKLLRHADPVVSRALTLVCGNGLSQRQAAKVIGVSEFKLSRALAKFSAHSCDSKRERVQMDPAERFNARGSFESARVRSVL